MLRRSLFISLLKRILQDRGHGMKIAVIVNDMGALNLDADEIVRHKLVKDIIAAYERAGGE